MRKAWLVLLPVLFTACTQKPVEPQRRPTQSSEVAPPPAAPAPLDVRDRYKVFVPKSAKKKPRPLLVVLHGCLQDAAAIQSITDFNAEAEKGKFLVLYAQQLKGRHPYNCWRWFDEQNQKPDGRAEVAEVLAMIEDAKAHVKIDPAQIFVAGLSSGAGLASELMACHPDVFKGGALHSGPAFGIAKDEATGARLLTDVRPLSPPSGRDCDPHQFRGRVLVIQGANDTVVHPGHSKDLLDQFTPDTSKANERLMTVSLEKVGELKTRVVCRGGAKPQECLVAVMQLGHAWSGGKQGQFSDPRGPSASEMVRRFIVKGESIFKPAK